MADFFMGEIRLFSFSFAPRGWASCDGATLPINQNQALFSLLGTTFGGNGVNTFQLPNLQGRVPLHDHNNMGQATGTSTHTLTTGEVPPHTHQVQGNLAAPASPVPTNSMFAAAAIYNDATNNPVTATLPTATVGQLAGSVAHENKQPYLPVNFCIALSGIYPSRS